MKSRVVRGILLLLVAAALGGAAYNIALLEREIARVQSAGRSFRDDCGQAERLVGELKAAQFAYVAPGQGPAFWPERADKLFAAISEQLKRLEQGAIGADARAHVDAALQALDSARQVDQTVQAYVRGGQAALASDLAFTEARQADENVAARIAAARWAERAVTSASLDVARRTELATAAGAGVFALIVMALLAFTGPGRKAGSTGDAPAPARGGLSIQDPRPEPSSPAVREDGAWPPADLSVAAALCTDFARLRENKDLPALLERFAGLIDASGIVVWIADPSSGELRPAIGYGYGSQSLARMRGIAQDADNATACAYREGTIQVVDGEGNGNGAIAVPLPTADGFVGVMAAEVRGGRERRANTQALATIVAAQMATLVAPQS